MSTESLSFESFESVTAGEVVHYAVLPSGLRFYFCHKPGFQKKYACYSTHYGSLHSDFTSGDGRRHRMPAGIAHFLEHTLFETEEGNVSDLFAKNGAYSNAATSFTTTTYLFSASDLFYENLALLLGFVEKPAFREEKVDKERGIIEQEISGYDDNADWVAYRSFLETLFREHPIRQDIAGTAATIAAIDVDKLQACYQAFYHPENMILFVTGDLERDRLADFVLEHSRREVEGPPVRECFFPEEAREPASARRRVELEVALPKLYLGFKEVGVPERGRESVLQDLASDMGLEMLLGRSSDTYQKLYAEGLVRDDFSASYGSSAGIGYAMIGGDTPEPERLAERLESELSSLLTRGIAAEDFEREKRKFVGNFVRGFNTLEYLANWYSYYRFHDYDIFETIELLCELTHEGLSERLRELVDPRFSARLEVHPK